MDYLFCFHIVLMVFSSVAFVLLTIGYSTPGWLLVTFEEEVTAREFTVSSINRSLWYDIHCPRELLDCKTCVYSQSDDCVRDFGFPGYSFHYDWLKEQSMVADRDGWLMWRILMTVVLCSAVLGFLLVITLVCCLLSPATYKTISIVGFLIWLLAGILIWPVVALVAKLHSDIKDDINDNVIHDASVDTPYSVILSAVGGFLALIVAFMLLWLAGVCCKIGDDDVSTLMDEKKSKISKVMHTAGYYGPQSVPGPYPYYVPEMPIEYRDAPRRMFSRDHSITTDEEFYVVESPLYVPGYDNRYLGAEFRETRRDERTSFDGSDGRPIEESQVRTERYTYRDESSERR